MKDNDVWLAALCHQKNWLARPVDELFMQALCKDDGDDKGAKYSLRVARYFLQQLNDTAIREMHWGDSRSTPLHIAALNSSPGLARVLIRRGANVNAMDTEKRSPLHLAVQFRDLGRSLKLVRPLLDKGADPNGCGMCVEPPVTFYMKSLRAMFRPRFHRTSIALPYILSSLSGIIAAGADVNKTNAAGETAVSIMEEILSYNGEPINGEASLPKIRIDKLRSKIRESFSLVYDDLGNKKIRLLQD